MTHPSSPAAARGRSPGAAAAVTWLVFAGGLPLIQWIGTALFASRGPAVTGQTWTGFVVTMALAGLLAAAMMYAAARRSRGWPRSILLGIVLALASGTDIQAFAARTPAAYGARWLTTSLLVGLMLAVFIHLLGRANQPR